MSRAMLLTILIWLLVAVSYGYATVSSKLALPDTPESYTRGVGFQVYAYMYFKLPGLLVALVLVLSAQFFLAKLRASGLPTEGKNVLRYSLVAGVVFILLAGIWQVALSGAPYNPYFQRDEQLVLRFLTSWAPLLAILMAGVLVAEYHLLKQRTG